MACPDWRRKYMLPHPSYWPAIEGLGDVLEVECLGVCQGCLRMFNFELMTGTLLVWYFKLVEPADQMVNGGNCLISMDPEILLSNAVIFSHNELDMHWIKKKIGTKVLLLPSYH
ncbi:hypothetical protein PRUPE_2G073200 [Prunus persica]|uniref:Uncharacterized protein n=1 Tax=Prunus persica TaxID=3760 RepID=A0A251QCJ7_PRUPE|nr:hypothetical protein PRUPE_2G073200 [Prunus persica]